jgi:hypothetical protein
MSASTQPLSFYDGRDFLITTPDASAPGDGFIQALDSAGIPMGQPLRIVGANKGPNHRYVLDAGGKQQQADFDYNGPIIGEELDRFMAAPEPLEAPILAKGREPDPSLGADLIQTGNVIVSAHPTDGASTGVTGLTITTAATPAPAPQPAHVVAPAKHVSTIAAVLRAIPADVLIAAKATTHGAEDAFRWLEHHV